MARRGTGTGRWFVVCLLGAAALAGFVALGIVLRDRGLDTAADVAQVVGLPVSLIPFGIALVDWARRTRRPSTDAPSVEDTVEDLAEKVYGQWAGELRARMVADPHPMPVEWSSPAPDATVVRGRRSGVRARDVQQARSDRVADFAKRFDRTSRCRLVLVGPPGSGKTTFAIQFLLALLRLRHRLDPVPVMLSLAGWDPATGLREWMARRIIEDHPSLPADQDMVSRLLARRLVLPVLDGLDEVPGAAREAVVRALNRSLDEGDGVVLTCRLVEYQEIRDAVPERVVNSAVVLQAQPLPERDIAAYVAACPGGRTWDRYATPARRAALLSVCSRPFGLWLTRTVLLEPAALGRPVSAADLPAAPEELRSVLLGALPGTLLEAGPAGERGPEAHWDAPHVERWLVHLAAHLERVRSQDFRWWRLARDSFSERLLRLIFALVFAVPWTVATPSALRDELSLPLRLLSAVGVAVVATAGWYQFTSPENKGSDKPRAGFLAQPQRGSYRLRGRGRELRDAVREAMGDSLRPVAGLTPGLAVVAVVALMSMDPPFALLPALLTGASIGLAAGGALLVFQGIVNGTTHWAQKPDRLDGPATPSSTLRADRASMVGVTVIYGGCALALGLCSAPLFGWAKAVYLGLTLVVFFCVQAPLQSAWTAYRLAVVLLAVRGRLPWRLTTFLAHMYRLGLLRISGTAYQFRHAELQEHLAARRPG